MESPIKKFIFERIKEENRGLYFTPALEIAYWILSEKDNTAIIYFDFGLQKEIIYKNWLTENCETAEEKIRKIIEFELFHAFMHINEDPNYSVFNWALFGNLFFRVKCLEDYEGEAKEIWGYKIKDNKLFKISYES